MKVTYTMSLADYRSAYRLARRGRFFFRYEKIIWPLITILSLVVFASSNPPNSEVAQQAASVFTLALVLSIVLPILNAIAAYRGYRSSLNRKRDSSENITEITTEKIIDITPGFCELTYTWPSIIGFAQNPKITLFRTSGSHLIFLPTRALTPDQVAELNEIVSRHGIRRWS